jgi:hypothetical protein
MEGMSAEDTTAECATAELAAADRPEGIGSASAAETKTASTVKIKSCMVMAGHARRCGSGMEAVLEPLRARDEASERRATTRSRPKGKSSRFGSLTTD